VTNGVGDDLKIVEGIGPRIETVLKGAGVTTYGELAELTPRRIERIMKEAGTRMAKPDTWPEQARLAADGRWEALQELQAQLKGGVLR
jgi:predicted flap endonuclease-1-like 5' DNA nuclease